MPMLDVTSSYFQTSKTCVKIRSRRYWQNWPDMSTVGHLRFIGSRKGHMFVGLNIEEPHARPISERPIPLYHHRSSIIILVILVGGFKHDWIIFSINFHNT